MQYKMPECIPQETGASVEKITDYQFLKKDSAVMSW